MTIEITPGDVLVVVDMQYDFLPGGSLAVSGGDEIVPLGERVEAWPVSMLWESPGRWT